MIFSPSLFIPHPADRTGGHEAGQDGGTTRRRFFRLPERPPGQDYLVFLILRINEPVEVAGLIRTVSVIILRGMIIVCGLRGCGRITRCCCWGRTSGHSHFCCSAQCVHSIDDARYKHIHTETITASGSA